MLLSVKLRYLSNQTLIPGNVRVFVFIITVGICNCVHTSEVEHVSLIFSRNRRIQWWSGGSLTRFTYSGNEPGYHNGAGLSLVYALLGPVGEKAGQRTVR